MGSFRVRLALIAAAGLALRVIYVLVLARDVGGAGDYAWYHATANLIADGKFFLEPFRLAAEGIETPSASHPPLWPLLLSPFSAIGATGEVAHKLVGCGVGALVIAATGVLGRRVGGERLGLVAAALAATYPVLITADGALMSEALYGLLIVLTLIAAYAMHDRATLGRAALLGALIGLAALTRSEALLLLGLLAAPLAYRAHPGWRRRAGLMAAAALAALLVLAPWSLRNWAAFDRPVLISTNDGTLLAGANCPDTYDGALRGSWSFDCISTATPSDNEAERSVRWRREGLEYARDNADSLPLVLAVRALRTWELYQPLEQIQFAEGRHRTVVRVGVVWYFALLPLAAVGLLSLRGRTPLWLLLAPVTLVIITSLLGYGIPRLRHAAEFPLVVLAAAGLLALLQRLRSPSANSTPASASAGSATAGISQSQSRPA
jgi:4-amino-4-deoxy-L-arabinose transferase-like glycosyltransferase